ncbi:MAG: type II 3-dehydroquinate dehydratase [Armatimonadetes bacterium]|nr:type II 3-dehydroquinate dehydratase [Armatimonadota bacterium]
MYGPNLNLLGVREPEHYGTLTLDAVNARVAEAARTLGVEVEFFQSNSEGALIDRLHEARSTHQAVVLNPGGLGHTSVALRDAVAAVGIPVVECHLSNLARREPFRHRSLLSAVCAGVISGFGPESMVLGLRAAAALLQADGQGPRAR